MVKVVLGLLLIASVAIVSCKDTSVNPADSQKSVVVSGPTTALLGVPTKFTANINFSNTALLHYVWRFSDSTFDRTDSNFTRAFKSAGKQIFTVAVVTGAGSSVVCETTDSVEVIGQSIQISPDTLTVAAFSWVMLHASVSAELDRTPYTLRWSYGNDIRIGHSTDTASFYFSKAGPQVVHVEYLDSIQKSVASATSIITVKYSSLAITVSASKSIVDPMDSIQFSIATTSRAPIYKWIWSDSTVLYNHGEPVWHSYYQPGQETVTVQGLAQDSTILGSAGVVISVRNVATPSLSYLQQMKHVTVLFTGSFSLSPPCYYGGPEGFSFAAVDTIVWNSASFDANHSTQQITRDNCGVEEMRRTESQQIAGNFDETEITILADKKASYRYSLGTSLNLREWSKETKIVANQLQCISVDPQHIRFALAGYRAKDFITNIFSEYSEYLSHSSECGGSNGPIDWSSATNPPVLTVTFTK